MDDIELKAEFVRLVSNGDEPMMAAMSLYPGDDKKAVEMFTRWTGDAKLMDSAAPVAKMKTKEELGKLIWSRAKIAEDKDSVNYLKLYAEISGFTSKANNVFNVENAVISREEIDAINTPAEAEKAYKRMLEKRN